MHAPRTEQLGRHRGRVLVAGGGGFLGGHLVDALLARGYREVRVVDHRPPAGWARLHRAANNVQRDLRDAEDAAGAVAGVDEIFNLASEPGAWTENVLINTNLLLAADERNVSRFTLASSEPGAETARWQRYAERTCTAFREEFGLATRIARLHQVYGPFDRRLLDARIDAGGGASGRPAPSAAWGPGALCRAFLAAWRRGVTLELPGSGHETGCFTWVGDAVEGLLRIHEGDCAEPLELGSRELVSTHRLLHLLEELAGHRPERRFTGLPPDTDGSRPSDNRRLRDALGWEPTTRLETGLRHTFEWLLAERRRDVEGPRAPLPGVGAAARPGATRDPLAAAARGREAARGAAGFEPED